MGGRILTETQIEEISRVYDGTTETLDRLVSSLGCKRHKIHAVASKLGLSKKKPKRWTADEKEYLRSNWGRKPAREIAEHLGRSETALQLMKKRLGVSTWAVAKDIGYSIRELEELTGLDHRQWHRFIDRGELRCHRLVTSDRNRVTTVIDIDSLHRWLKERPEGFDYSNAPARTKSILELDELQAPPKYKQLTCKSNVFDDAEKRTIVNGPFHQGEPVFEIKHCRYEIESCSKSPYSFWVPTNEKGSRCPRCGSMVSRYSASKLYDDDEIGNGEHLNMLAEKLGISWTGQTLQHTDGTPANNEDLIRYAFASKRNPGKAFKVFAKLLAAGLRPTEDKPICPNSIEHDIVDYTLKPRQKSAWEAFKRTGNIGVFWPPGEGKCYIGAYALTRLSGKHLVFVNSSMLREQWVQFLVDHTPHATVRRVWKPYHYKVSIRDEAKSLRCEIGVYSYRTHADFSCDNITLALFDEAHFMVGNQAHRLALIPSKHRIGLTASPFREDGREEVIKILTGNEVVGAWSDILAERPHSSPKIDVIVTASYSRKIEVLEEIFDPEKRTLVFSDSLEVGRDASNMLNIPFVWSETKSGATVLRESKSVVISRVGDHGLDLPDLERVIELSFHGGSRCQELQRYGRLLHSTVATDHTILMTQREFSHYHKRISVLEMKGFDISIKTIP